MIDGIEEQKSISLYKKMKTKTTKQTTIILAIALSFFLGRESKGVNVNYSPTLNTQSLDNGKRAVDIRNLLYKNDTDTVYRCGKSKIYHPTLQHGSFKICKSMVTKLTVKDAKSMGMRHCKCR